MNLRALRGLNWSSSAIIAAEHAGAFRWSPDSCPTWNFDLSTDAGRPPLLTKSLTKLLAPRMRLSPPVSTIWRSAVGFTNSMFDGASASIRIEPASLAR